MDLQHIKNWAAQPDVCRCCLSASGDLDLNSSFINENGFKEVYTDIIEECFGISMSYIVGWATSRLICNDCIRHLHDAQSFRKQILQAEKHYKEFMLCEFQAHETVKIKIEEENDSDKLLEHELYNNEKTEDNNTANGDSQNYNTIEIEIKLENQANNEQDQPKTKKKLKMERQTPASSSTAEDTYMKNVYEQEDVKHKDTSSKGPEHTMRKAVKTKHKVPERTRMYLTLNTILKYTNACIFRHHKSWFQCFFCVEEFMEINLLRQHIKENHPDIEDEVKRVKNYPNSLQIEISDLKCHECSTDLKDIESMRLHFAEVHKLIIYNECIVDYKVNCSPYFCHICNKEFHVFRMLTMHLNEHYAHCICDVCGKSFINNKRLKCHKRIHEIGSFPCLKCDKILITKSSLSNHMESMHSKRVLKCNICQEPMKHYHDRVKHMSEVHNITHIFKCHICDREFNIKHYLSSHLRQTHGNKDKKCGECDKAFITGYDLKMHMLTHSGVKQYSCNLCSKSYARGNKLREHMRTHANETFLEPD